MTSKTKKITIILVIIAGLAYAGFRFLPNLWRSDLPEFTYDQVKKGSISNTISSSGTLSPVTTVQVGTQVSGTIAKVYADFNDQVKKGQLLAVLDTSLLRATLTDAQAGVERNIAQLEEAQSNYDRNKQLYDRQIISASTFLPFYINLKLQRANVKSARAALARAEYNLRYAVIRSPISGKVISRNVEAGQTVAASFSTPTLFEIAEDLSQMEILAQVDESDIGSIKVGQDVLFQVQTYSDRTFKGKVQQIRLNPVTVSNVVNYIVVVSAQNKENLLLPGMTAMVDFVTEKAENVLLVPAKALRFQPTEAMMKQYIEAMKKRIQDQPDSVRNMYVRNFRRNGNTSGGVRSSQNRQFNRLWYLDDNGNLMMVRVKTGISDGKLTEIVSGRNIKEGMKIITGISTGTGASQSTSNGMPRFRRSF